jgi:hypothetical protein
MEFLLPNYGFYLTSTNKVSKLIILCIIIVNAVVWVELGILLTQKSSQSMSKEEDIESIISLIRNLF